MSTSPLAEDRRSGFITARRVTAAVIVVLALIFIFSNTASATLRFLGLHWSMPGWVWFIVLFAAGVIAGSLWPWLTLKRRMGWD